MNISLDTLKSFDWGVDPEVLKPIDDAVVQTHADPAARKDLEAHLVAGLESDLPLPAKGYICRKLVVVGTAAAVPVLTKLLADPHLSHMARYALERIPAPEALAALMSGLEGLPNALKVGALASLGAKGDDSATTLIAKQLSDSDAAVASAAVRALGRIRTGAAAHALAHAKYANDVVKQLAADASLACADALLKSGDSGVALLIFKQFTGEGHAKHVKVAATRGVLACAGKKS